MQVREHMTDLFPYQYYHQKYVVGIFFIILYCLLTFYKTVFSPIRIYHECGGRIKKSAPRITVWHHKACRVMTNGDPKGWIFLSYPHTNNGLFFLLTTVFYFKISFQKPLNTLRCNIYLMTSLKHNNDVTWRPCA